MSYGSYPCPKCQNYLVERQKPKGALPRCAACLEASVRGRLDRQAEKRRSGYDAHRDDQGRRYGETLPKCRFCDQEFINTRRGAVEKCCDACMPKHEEELQLRKNEAKKTIPYKEKANKSRRLRKLEAQGLDASWRAAQGDRCAICGTETPNGRGWSIDHDHTCCAQGCVKCVRGVLCSNCNLGLGYFKDDPIRLQAAIGYLSRSCAERAA